MILDQISENDLFEIDEQKKDPFPGEHAARLLDPKTKKIRARRTKGSGKGKIQGVTIPTTISIIWYIIKSGNREIPRAQSLRFPIENWTAQEAKKWLKENEIEYKIFEPAKEKKDSKDKNNNVCKVQRFDYFPIEMICDMKSQLEKSFKLTNEGYLKGRAIITNIGVFPYMNSDGSTRWELRCPEEVLKENSLKTLLMKPITNEHPDQKIDIENIKDFQVGFTGNECFNDAYHVATDISFTDKKTIMDINNGKRALSAGYELELEETPGVFMGVPYDAIQKNIRYNHVSVVDKGRAGDAAKIRMDSLNSAYYMSWNNNDKKEDDNMNLKVVKLDGIEYQAEGEVIKELNQAKDQTKSLQEKIDQLEKEKTTLEAERDTFKDKVDQISKELEDVKNDTSSIEVAVKKRMLILDIAKKAGVEIKKDMTELDIQKAVIIKVFPKANLDGKDELYISARFDGVIEFLEEKNNAVNREILDIQKDSYSVDSSKKREEMIKRIKEQSRNLEGGK